MYVCFAGTHILVVLIYVCTILYWFVCDHIYVGWYIFFTCILIVVYTFTLIMFSLVIISVLHVCRKIVNLFYILLPGVTCNNLETSDSGLIHKIINKMYLWNSYATPRMLRIWKHIFVIVVYVTKFRLADGWNISTISILYLQTKTLETRQTAVCLATCRQLLLWNMASATVLTGTRIFK